MKYVTYQQKMEMWILLLYGILDASLNVNELQNRYMDVPQYIVRWRAVILNMFCEIGVTDF